MNDEKLIQTRYDLTTDRMRKIETEESVAPRFRDYFRKTSSFLLLLDNIRKRKKENPDMQCSLQELQRENRALYEDILPGNYEKSYADPQFCVNTMGEEYGRFLSALYAELRSAIPYVYEEEWEQLTICNELFVEVYNAFEEAEFPAQETLHDIFYWYASDYCDVFVPARIRRQVDPEADFAVRIILDADVSDLRYLYHYGEYISDDEIITAQHMSTLPDDVVQKMADVYTEGYRKGFEAAGIDLSRKKTVNIHYNLGFERMMKKAIENFARMGLRPTAFRATTGVVTRRPNRRNGYGSCGANRQYEYDHRYDQALFFDKRFVERKLDVTRHAFGERKDLAACHAGPAVVEVFGEEPFVPVQKKEACALTKKQEELSVLYDTKSGQITNRYIKGDERSFTIVAYPLPSIGGKYPEIFQEIIRINTLDATRYEKIQQTIIDALDQGEYVQVTGKGDNRTDLRIRLQHLQDPKTETIFENCVADVNIPVGEVFTSPVLKGTNGILHVSRVYLNGLQYRDLSLTFCDGMVEDYNCRNFDDEQEAKAYIRHNVLYNHETLPMGEFAIGTNTTAYVAAAKYGIEDKLPILIAEKMGPHFALGDTCYSWSEEQHLYNQNGKEIIAKDNEISILRKEDVSKAYFQCHTDITIPYEELLEICVVCADGRKVNILRDGRFVLPGTEALNEPFDEA